MNDEIIYLQEKNTIIDKDGRLLGKLYTEKDLRRLKADAVRDIANSIPFGGTLDSRWNNTIKRDWLYMTANKIEFGREIEK